MYSRTFGWLRGSPTKSGKPKAGFPEETALLRCSELGWARFQLLSRVSCWCVNTEGGDADDHLTIQPISCMHMFLSWTLWMHLLHQINFVMQIYSWVRRTISTKPHWQQKQHLQQPQESTHHNRLLIQKQQQQPSNNSNSRDDNIIRWFIITIIDHH